MRIDVAFTPAEAARAEVGVVVDVMRASSRIAQALVADRFPRAVDGIDARTYALLGWLARPQKSSSAS